MPPLSHTARAASRLALRKAAIPGIALTSLMLAACVPTEGDSVALAVDAEIAQAGSAITAPSPAASTKPMQYAGLAESDDAPFQQGRASFYRHGSRTANGERFDPSGMTAAHPSLPFGTRVRVVHPASGNAVVVRINDRGPFTGGRVIDLAEGAARKLGIIRAGVAPVALYRLD
jgi:rare lipoprotein A